MLQNSPSIYVGLDVQKESLAIELASPERDREVGNDSNLLIVFYVQIMPDDLVMQLHRF